MPRFVVLLHETPQNHPRPTHWDFMLEDGDSLATWALQDEPHSSRQIAAEVLPPHRLAYLDYEGPISQNRGVVTKWDHGTFVWKSRGDDWAVVALTGSRLEGVATIQQQHGRWFFSLSSSLDAAAHENGNSDPPGASN